MYNIFLLSTCLGVSAPIPILLQDDALLRDTTEGRLASSNSTFCYEDKDT